MRTNKTRTSKMRLNLATSMEINALRIQTHSHSHGHMHVCICIYTCREPRPLPLPKVSESSNSQFVLVLNSVGRVLERKKVKLNFKKAKIYGVVIKEAEFIKHQAGKSNIFGRFNAAKAGLATLFHCLSLSPLSVVH